MHFKGGSVNEELPVVFHMMARKLLHMVVDVVVVVVEFAMPFREANVNAAIPVDFLMMVLRVEVVHIVVDILQLLVVLVLATLSNVVNAREEMAADFLMKMVE